MSDSSLFGTSEDGALMSLDYGYGSDDERDEADRADTASEKALELLHASAIRFCPTCDTTVLTRRNGTCVWDDGPTLPQRGARD